MKYSQIIRCCFSTKNTQTMHFHPDIEIIYVLDGAVKVNFVDASYPLNTEDFLLINSNVRHEYVADKDLLVGCLMIDYTMLSEIFDGEQLFFWCNSVESNSSFYEKLRYSMRQIFNLYQQMEGQAVALKNSIYYQLIYQLTSNFLVKKGKQQYDSLRGIKDERLDKILSVMMSRYNEPLTLKELSAELYLSNAYLSKYIKKHFGMRFLKLLGNIRLEYAVSDLMYTDKTILKVAMDNGFPNMASFNQVFKESYYMTPAEYRVEMQQKNEDTAASDTGENSIQVFERVEQYLTSNLVQAPEVADSSVSVLIADTMAAEPNVRYWQRMINIGPAVNLLRYDVRAQVQFLKEKLDFEYMRIWQIFSEEMLIQLGEHNVKYNFMLLDQVLDFLVNLKIKPHIEFGFKKHTYFEKVDRSILKIYKDHSLIRLMQNKGFLEDLIKHWTTRYGTAEVETWYIELEKNSVIQETVSLEQYFEVFETVYAIFKNYAPGIQIGGAGFSLNVIGKSFEDILRQWKKRKYQPDFVSIYSYPYNYQNKIVDEQRNEYASNESYLADVIDEAYAQMKMAGMTDIPLLVTEWSSTLSNRNCLNDSCYKSAYMVKNMIENYGKVPTLGYWVATDIFSEGIDLNTFLSGGCGLITQNDICKPAYFAMEFMNHLEPYIIGKNENAIVSSRKDGVYFICCHNYKHLNFRYYSRNENDIEIENQQRYFSDNESLQMSFRIRHVNHGKYIVKIFFIGPTHGNVQNEWKQLGYLESLSIYETDYLKRHCQPELSVFYVEAKNNELVIETHIADQEIQGIVVAEV